MFPPKKNSPKRGRKSDQALTDCLDQLYAYLEDDSECQYTLTELHSLLNNFSDKGEICSRKWLKKKLIEHYGDDIIIADPNCELQRLWIQDIPESMGS